MKDKIVDVKVKASAIFLMREFWQEREEGYKWRILR